MKYLLFVLLFVSVMTMSQEDQQMIDTIYQDTLKNGECYENLRRLCKNVGGRLSGSKEAEKAVLWGKETLEKVADKVYLQELSVPHWERGEKEQATIVDSAKFPNKSLNICALGGSVGTGTEGVVGELVEVHNFEELAKLGKENIQGKIVFFNRPMNPTFVNAFRAYSDAVRQRTQGASEAAKYGAIATLVRSMTLRLDDFPHTGAMRYQQDVPQIPAAAVSTNDAELLSSLLREEKKVKVSLKMNCQVFPDAKSHNVIGEIVGTEHPEEIIVIGGHLDSWDLGEGAHDDGAGCVHSIEVLRIFRDLKIKPKRTIRVVLFMNEENGLQGAYKYAEEAKVKKEFHLAAIESDSGGFTPRGFSIDADIKKVEQVTRWQSLFTPYDIYAFFPGGSGADVGQLKDGRVTLIGFRPDSQRYFDYHHTNVDVFESVNKRELELGSATIASLVYLIDKYGIK